MLTKNPKNLNKIEKINTICDKLEELYPNAVCSLEYEEPYQLLIATRLSAQCTDERVNKVTPALFKRFPNLESFAQCDLQELENFVHSCGFYHSKARDIKSLCGKLLEIKEIPDTIEELVKLPGVGRKTANLILGDIFHKPAIVTDTHFIRIMGRLGFTSSTNSHVVEKDLLPVLPPEKSSDFCHRIVIFGREICKARKPECNICPFNSEICNFYSDNREKSDEKS